jgi:hypothetical protein
MLSEQERRSLQAIEREELARDPMFLRDCARLDQPPVHRFRSLRTMLLRAHPWSGPLLILLAAVMTVPLLALSPAWAVLGIGVAAVGLVLSLGPGARVAARWWAALTAKRDRPS